MAISMPSTIHPKFHPLVLYPVFIGVYIEYVMISKIFLSAAGCKLMQHQDCLSTCMFLFSVI